MEIIEAVDDQEGPSLSAGVIGSGVVSGDPLISFAAHEVRAGHEGAREDFEKMLGQLVRAVLPGARMIAANPGDWGIDVLVGLLSGKVAVWQSKFFYPVTARGHQQEIRDSLKAAIVAADREGHTISQWTLCIPSSMDGPTASWWDGFKRRKQREHKIIINLWDETELRGLLISPDAIDVRNHYYGNAQRTIPHETPPVAVPEEDAAQLDHALFVKQLRAAGRQQVAAAKRQFFNAELMAREIVDKGVTSEVGALTTADATVHSLWEDRFNEFSRDASDPQLPGLHNAVMSDIQQNHSLLSRGLPGGLIHSRGLMHRVVDDQRAGWISRWEDVAAQHSSESNSAEAQEEPPEDQAEGGVPAIATTGMNNDRAN
ncbi:hypothetical protein AAHS21_26885 [Mycobacterium sp. 050272]|uniref:hypothetical protein n=1 Tax=Mycobacterium sp. 050272 TaxID=3142488 RepID=UPI00318E7F05